MVRLLLFMAVVSPSVLAAKTSVQKGANAPKVLMRAERLGEQNMATVEAGPQAKEQQQDPPPGKQDQRADKGDAGKGERHAKAENAVAEMVAAEKAVADRAIAAAERARARATQKAAAEKVAAEEAAAEKAAAAAAEKAAAEQAAAEKAAAEKTAAEEAAAAATPTPPINIRFGGNGNERDVDGGQGVQYKIRGEQIKALYCEDDAKHNIGKCFGCVEKAACFHGKSMSSMRKHYLALDVPADGVYNHHKAELWASCHADSGKWTLKILPEEPGYKEDRHGKHGNGLQNGVLTLYVNGKMFKTISPDTEQLTFEIPITGDSHIMVVFTRTDRTKAAWALIRFAAKDVDAGADKCMGVKDCLRDLVGSEAAYALRNSNKHQWKCVMADSSVKRIAISKECDVWFGCLSTEGQLEKMQTFLGAAMRPRGGKGALLDKRSKKNSKMAKKKDSKKPKKANTSKKNSLGQKNSLVSEATDSVSATDSPCFDPSTEDPESWECECFDEMAESCGGPNEECIRKMMCNKCSLCLSWKQTHCSSNQVKKHKKKCTGTSSLLMQRSENNETTTAKGNMDGTLQDTLKGKCSSESQ